MADFTEAERADIRVIFNKVSLCWSAAGAAALW